MSAGVTKVPDHPGLFEVKIPVVSARTIADDSWLQAEDCASFRAALACAGTQLLAVPTLSAVDPEDLFYAYHALQRGEKRFADQEGELPERPLPGPTGVEQVRPGD